MKKKNKDRLTDFRKFLKSKGVSPSLVKDISEYVHNNLLVQPKPPNEANDNSCLVPINAKVKFRGAMRQGCVEMTPEESQKADEDRGIHVR